MNILKYGLAVATAVGGLSALAITPASAVQSWSVTIKVFCYDQDNNEVGDSLVTATSIHSDAEARQAAYNTAYAPNNDPCWGISTADHRGGYEYQN